MWNVFFKKYFGDLNKTKVFWFLIVFSLLLFFLNSNFNFARRPKLDQKIVSLKLSAENSKQAEKDTDGDGLFDWEEKLWGTNPSQKDTDGDGQSDFSEIIERKKSAGIISEEKAGGDRTETNFIAQEFYSALVTLKHEGSFNNQNLNNIGEALGESLAESVTVPTLKTSDFLIVENTEENKKYFLEKLREVAKPLFSSPPGTELEFIATNYPLTQKGEVFLTKNASNYLSLAEELKSLPVPRESFSNFKKFVESVFGLGLATTELSQTNKDPIRGMKGLGLYRLSYDQFVSIEDFVK